MKILTPPIKIQGKKSKLVKWILNFIPKDFIETKLYIEPFVDEYERLIAESIL